MTGSHFFRDPAIAGNIYERGIKYAGSMKPRIKTFSPNEMLPSRVILPQQTHGNRVVEIVTGEEDLSDCDGIWTRDPQFILGVKTADCAPIVFQDSEKYGVFHAGWRGLCNGILEEALNIFDDRAEIWIGPLLPDFEIQKDFCYEAISGQFGEAFLATRIDEKYDFDFQSALNSILPQAQFDPRITLTDPALTSWRQNQTNERNITIVGHWD